MNNDIDRPTSRRQREAVRRWMRGLPPATVRRMAELEDELRRLYRRESEVQRSLGAEVARGADPAEELRRELREVRERVEEVRLGLLELQRPGVH